jgi:hypothetical protein
MNTKIALTLLVMGGLMVPLCSAHSNTSSQEKTGKKRIEQSIEYDVQGFSANTGDYLVDD